MTTIYQVATTSGIVKGTFVFLDNAQEFIKTKEPLCRIIPLTVEITKTTGGKKNASEKLQGLSFFFNGELGTKDMSH